MRTKHLIIRLSYFSCILLVSCTNEIPVTAFESNKQDTATEKPQEKIYILKKKSLNADFNYAKLKNLDGNLGDSMNLKPLFEPVDGKFIYYQFIATFKGLSEFGYQTFHDILIIKTDKSNKIIDAYQYTLEWTELPCQYDLYKMNASNILLVNNLDIKSLNFVRTDYWDEKDKLFKDSGTIKLN